MKKKLKNISKYCLFLDTSGTDLSIGISVNDIIIDKISYQCLNQKDQLLILEIHNILQKNKILLEELNALIIINGPGSYVGIRIAVVVAKIFTLILRIPVYQISSLEARKILNQNSIVLINARFNRSYIAAFDKNNNYVLKDQIMDNNDVKQFIKKHNDFLLVGDLEYLNLIGQKNDVLNNMNIIFKHKKYVKNPNLIQPIYLKDKF